jgi:hypothetical protein
MVNVDAGKGLGGTELAPRKKLRQGQKNCTREVRKAATLAA